MPLNPDGSYRKPTYDPPAETSTGTTTPVAASTPMPPPPPNAPSWYVNNKSTDLVGSFANALLPYMSPEDMRAVAGNLSGLSEYSAYKNASFPDAPTEITPELRANYLSSDRASKALSAITNMAQLTGKSEADLGSGYSYLKDVLGTMQRLGGQNGQGMSRAQYQEFYNAVQGFKSKAQDNYDLAPYASLADYITNPTFSSGSISNTGRDAVSGKLYYAKQNKKLFG